MSWNVCRTIWFLNIGNWKLEPIKLRNYMQGKVASHYYKMKQNQYFSEFISMFFVAQCLYDNMNLRHYKSKVWARCYIWQRVRIKLRNYIRGIVASHHHKMKQKQSFSEFIWMFFVAQCLYDNMNFRHYKSKVWAHRYIWWRVRIKLWIYLQGTVASHNYKMKQKQSF